MRCLVVVALALACAAAQSTCETLATDCTSCYATASPAVEGGCVYCETFWIDAGGGEVYTRSCEPLRVNATLTRNATETCWALTRGLGLAAQKIARVLAPDDAVGCTAPRGNGWLASCVDSISFGNDAATCTACNARPHCLACTTPFSTQPGLWCVFYARAGLCSEKVTQCAGASSPSSTTTTAAAPSLRAGPTLVVALAASGWALL